jgi:hypothetical protein
LALALALHILQWLLQPKAKTASRTNKDEGSVRSKDETISQGQDVKFVKYFVNIYAHNLVAPIVQSSFWGQSSNPIVLMPFCPILLINLCHFVHTAFHLFSSEFACHLHRLALSLARRLLALSC